MGIAYCSIGGPGVRLDLHAPWTISCPLEVLKSHLKTRLDPQEAKLILIQAGRALEHARQNGLVHRDIKPSNFLVSRTNTGLLVKLTDMGLSRATDDEDFRVTKAGTTVGTVDYM